MKHPFLLLLFFSLTFNSFSNELIDWQKTFGGRFSDKVNAAKTTSDGGLIIVGWTNSKGVGAKDGWVIKLTANGDVFFEQTYGNTQNNILNDVAEDPNGGYTAVGESVDELTGYTKAWVIHFDELGELEWERTYGQSEYVSGKKIVYTPYDKGYLMLNSREEKGDHDMNSWVLKLNKKGQMLWQSVSQNRYLDDEGADISLTTDEGYIISGYIADKFKVKNLLLTKYDKRGTKVWGQEYGGTKNDEATAILATSDGMFLICGLTDSEGKGGADALLKLVDKSGRVAIEKTVGGIANDSIFTAIEITDGFILAGKTESKGKGKNDNWIVKVDKDLNLLWQYTTGDTGDEEIRSILQKDGSISFITVENAIKEGSDQSNVVVTKYTDAINNEQKREPKQVIAQATENSSNITIISPMVRRGFKTVINTEMTEIKGRVSANNGLSSVTVNGKEAMLGSAGEFSVQLAIQLGTNNVAVVATEKNGSVHKKTFTIDRAADVKSGEVADFRNVAGKFYALLIGVEDYQDEEINNLDRPIDDAMTLYNTLTTYYTFEPENVRLLKNPGRSDIIMALDQLSKEISEDDNLIIFYAGHGYWDPEQKLGYWLPADAMKSNTANWVRNSTIRDYVSAIKSKHTLLIADACFSGGIFKTRAAFNNSDKAINMLHKLNSRKAMTSGTLKEVPDQSAFIEYLNKQLVTNDKEYLPSEELFSLFRMAVINNSPNVPQYGTIKDSGDEGGEFIFIKRK